MNGVVAISEELAATELNEDQKNLVEILRASASSMMRIVDDILLFSKMEASKLVLIPEVFKIRKIIESISSITSVRAKSKQLDFRSDIGDQIPEFVYLDQTRLRQVLTNLLDNAIKFTIKGHIGIRVRAADGEAAPCCFNVDHKFDDKLARKTQAPLRPPSCQFTTVLFEIYDSGVGLSADMMAKLFQPFQQAENKQLNASPSGGTGLGLAISAELVHLMGGQFHVLSQVNQGSCFSFSIRSQSVTVSGRRVADGERIITSGTSESKIALRYDQVFTSLLIVVCVQSRERTPWVDCAVRQRRRNGKPGVANSLAVFIRQPHNGGDSSTVSNLSRQAHQHFAG